MKLLSSSEGGGGGGSGEVLLIPPFFLPWHFSFLFLNKLVQYTSRDVGFFFSHLGSGESEKRNYRRTVA